MANRKNSKTPRNDFEYDEGQVYKFTDEVPIVGDVIASFSFNDTSKTQTIELNPASKINYNNTNAAETNETFTSK